MTDYEQFLDDVEQNRQRQEDQECKQGRHTWEHGYNFARCLTCGEHMPITRYGGIDDV